MWRVTGSICFRRKTSESTCSKTIVILKMQTICSTQLIHKWYQRIHLNALASLFPSMSNHRYTGLKKKKKWTDLLVLAMESYHEEVADVNHKAVLAWLHCDPLLGACDSHLQSRHGVLVQDSDQVWISVSSKSDDFAGLGAFGVEVEAHGRHPVRSEVVVYESVGVQAQPFCEKLHYAHCQILHAGHVLLDCRAAHNYHIIIRR